MYIVYYPEFDIFEQFINQNFNLSNGNIKTVVIEHIAFIELGSFSEGPSTYS